MTSAGNESDDTSGSGNIHSELAGSTGDVVQARDVHGGVHFHGPPSISPRVPPPRQLPGDSRGFVNRRAELAYLDRVLAGDPNEPLAASVTVIAGTAGVGKTALALHWSHRVQDRFPDGQLYVNLHGYGPGPPVTAARALDQFLRTLSVPPGRIPGDPEGRAALYRSVLAGRRILVVLDNAFNERQVRPLLPGAAGSLALITSRSRLRGLAVREGAHHLTLDVLSEDEAVRLIRAVTSNERAEDGEAELVELAQLCGRLPLALRIAAERAAGRPRMGLGELIEGLRDESGLWDILTTGDDEDADAVRTVFAWSYRALPVDAARAFRLLGLHPGHDFSAEAAGALIQLPQSDLRRITETLIGAHLLDEATPGRYQLHDLLRAYAADQARTEETPDTCATALRRCVTWYLHTAAAAQKVLDPAERGAPLEPPVPGLVPLSFTDHDAVRRWVQAERANLVAVVRAAADHGMDDLVWRFPLVLLSLYHGLNAIDDWITTGRLGLEAARRIGDSRAEAGNLESLGMAAYQAGRLDEGADYYAAALALLRRLDDPHGQAMALNGLALIDLRRWKLPAARESFQQARSLVHELGDEFWAAQMTANLAKADLALGDLGQAEALLMEAVHVFRAHQQRSSVGDCLIGLSRIARERGRADDALAFASEAVDIAQAIGSRVAEAFWLLELAAVQRTLSNPDEALATCRLSASLHRQLGDRTREALAWDATGGVYQDLDRPDDAIPFHRMAATVHHDLGDRWNEANALAHLAQALTACGRPDEAAAHRRQAAALLEGYDDPRAAELRAGLQTTDRGGP